MSDMPDMPALNERVFSMLPGWSNKAPVYHPPWMSVALAEVGVATYPPGQSNPRVTEYHGHTNIRGYDDKAAWCSSFVNWSLAQAGIVGTRSALARSWLEWGNVLSEPIPGCIAVLSREDPAGWKGHVGFYLRADDTHVHLLGGNQLAQVREHFYPSATVLGYRWPAKKNVLTPQVTHQSPKHAYS